MSTSSKHPTAPLTPPHRRPGPLCPQIVKNPPQPDAPPAGGLSIPPKSLPPLVYPGLTTSLAPLPFLTPLQTSL